MSENLLWEKRFEGMIELQVGEAGRKTILDQEYCAAARMGENTGMRLLPKKAQKQALPV